MNAKPAKFVTGRSMLLALLLAFFFGPLGLFYASVLGGALMLIGLVIGVPLIAAALAQSLQGTPLPVFGVVMLAIAGIWVLCLLWAIVAVIRRNLAARAYINQVNAAS